MLHERLGASRVKVKCLEKIGHLTKSVGHTQRLLVGHVKRPPIKKIESCQNDLKTFK